MPIPHALMPIIDREFGPDENNAEIAKLAAKEGLAALEGKNSPTSDALLYSASLTLWHLGRYDSVPDAAFVVREILSSGTTVERFRRAAGAKNG